VLKNKDHAATNKLKRNNVSALLCIQRIGSPSQKTAGILTFQVYVLNTLLGALPHPKFPGSLATARPTQYRKQRPIVLTLCQFGPGSLQKDWPQRDQKSSPMLGPGDGRRRAPGDEEQTGKLRFLKCRSPGTGSSLFDYKFGSTKQGSQNGHTSYRSHT
jgi:hypothetical protein